MVESRVKDVAPEIEYGERYCAFVDIIGFEELISRLKRGQTPANRLRSLLLKIHQPYAGRPERFQGSDFRSQSISDAVALSTNPTEKGLRHLFFVLEELAVDLLFEGYFVRGAIVRGDLYHDEKMVFGEALVEAYNLERTVVDFPRIMVPRAVMKDAQDTWAKDYKKHIRQAEDGPFYVHVLRDLEHRLETGGVEDDWPYYKKIAQHIQSRFRQAVDNPRHFRKVQWFARYWNSIVPADNEQGVPRIRGAGLEP